MFVMIIQITKGFFRELGSEVDADCISEGIARVSY